jgi:hypothetical protein
MSLSSAQRSASAGSLMRMPWSKPEPEQLDLLDADPDAA